MLHEKSSPEEGVAGLYRHSAKREDSWDRSNWLSKENQENGFKNVCKILNDYPYIKSILDVGCGDGKITDFLPDNITDYVGIDICKEIVDVADDPRIKHADIKTFNTKRTYDAVIAIGSFNMGVTFDDLVLALQHMTDLCDVIMICNISYLQTRDQSEMWGEPMKTPLVDERRLLRELGYTVIEHPGAFEPENGHADRYTIIQTV